MEMFTAATTMAIQTQLKRKMKRKMFLNDVRRNTFQSVHPTFTPLTTGLSIGTGMLFHTGPRLYAGGPGALLLSYSIVATILYAVLV